MRPSALLLGLAIQASFLLRFGYPFSTNHNLPTRQHAASSASTSLSSQTLDFIEPTTGVPVKLVGAMHYNPASIQLAIDEINALESEGKLGSIVIESCDIRWNATMENNEAVKQALLSEMKAAHDLGLEYNRPVVLGDQRINVTVAQLKIGAKEAVLDLVQPWNGGWNRLYESISSARKEAVPIGDQFLGAGSFFDPKLLGASPVSFIKYPLSYFVKSPLFTAAVLTLIALSSVESSNAITAADSMSGTDLLGSFTFSALETVIFARIFLKELLADRNEVLAENILEQCRNYEVNSSSGWLDKLFQSQGDKSQGAIYAPDSVVGKAEGDGKVVVAVLGLAHCNGIKKLLTEESI